MSTRSFIGYEQDNGSVKYAYCHFDGYLEGVGRELSGMDRDDAIRLVNRGDMSTVGDHYARRGEPWSDVAPKVCESLTAFERELNSSWCEWAYVMRLDGKWYYRTRHITSTWRSL